MDTQLIISYKFPYWYKIFDTFMYYLQYTVSTALCQVFGKLY